jgi:hypothetical protein
MRPRTCPRFQLLSQQQWGRQPPLFLFTQDGIRRKYVKAKGPEQKRSIFGLALKGNRGDDVKLNIGDQLHVWFMIKVADADTIVELCMVWQSPLVY